ncbi:hypothetical protein [Shewanella waksmanii]|uniref:hypothetical protein n=1 Tax=Shewanella waksmanii TaxID=213783 RepID=UPI003734F8B9
MKKAFYLGLSACLLTGSVAATEYLDADTAVGMASLMVCSTFYSENNMQVEGTIVGSAATAHMKAGIDEMIVSEEVSDKLAAYMDNFKGSSKEQRSQICEQAIEFARNSRFAD